MPFVRVSPDDPAQIEQVHRILEAGRLVDDPGASPRTPSMIENDLRHGKDLEPDETYLYVAEGRPVAVLITNMPQRDNRQLVWSRIVVDPARRRQGHGTAVLAELLRLTREVGRSVVWTVCPEAAADGRAFLESHGFRLANGDARRVQVLAEVDGATIARLEAEAVAASADYELERLRPPTPDAILEQLVEVTAAINDAPMGELTFEEEHFDLHRLRDIETAHARSGERTYRIIARHRDSGAVGGHTELRVHPDLPQHAAQWDTAVARDHRGHRLGLRLKLAMMAWLAEAEPQVEEVETWNAVENRPMIAVNEALGYRLSGVVSSFERVLA